MPAQCMRILALSLPVKASNGSAACLALDGVVKWQQIPDVTKAWSRQQRLMLPPQPHQYGLSCAGRRLRHCVFACTDSAKKKLCRLCCSSTDAESTIFHFADCLVSAKTLWGVLKQFATYRLAGGKRACTPMFPVQSACHPLHSSASNFAHPNEWHGTEQPCSNSRYLQADQSAAQVEPASQGAAPRTAH